MRQVISWSTFALVIAAAFLLAGPSSLGGPANYVIVVGSSMEPTYHHGDLVVAYERDGYQVGDVIVYDAPVDAQFHVIHRIIERTDGGFITQGDNRDEPDGWIAPDDEIYGAASFHIPRAGTIAAFLRQPATILALIAGWLTFVIMDRRSRRTDSGTGDDLDPPNQGSPDSELGETTTTTVCADASSPEKAAVVPNDGDEHRAGPSGGAAIAVVAFAALVGSSGGIYFAHAATLRVDAGVLQTFQASGPDVDDLEGDGTEDDSDVGDDSTDQDDGAATEAVESTVDEEAGSEEHADNDAMTTDEGDRHGTGQAGSVGATPGGDTEGGAAEVDRQVPDETPEGDIEPAGRSEQESSELVDEEADDVIADTE